jgi:hypothetical protein
MNPLLPFRKGEMPVIFICAALICIPNRSPDFRFRSLKENKTNCSNGNREPSYNGFHVGNSWLAGMDWNSLCVIRDRFGHDGFCIRKRFGYSSNMSDKDWTPM